MLRKILTATLLAVALHGCASVQPFTPQVRVESKNVFEKNYSLGVEASAYVGEPIVKVKDYYETLREAEGARSASHDPDELVHRGHAPGPLIPISIQSCDDTHSLAIAQSLIPC
jgi:hypothetical protein